MTLQSKVLQRYRQSFPNETLREISLRTGIQITRVFRLFNGRTMKVGELEAFEKAIADERAKNPNIAKLTESFDLAITFLNEEELKKINEYLERKIQNNRYSRFYISNKVEHAIIA